MAIYIGTGKAKEIYLGANKVKEIYLGANKVFQSGLYLIKDGVKQTIWTASGKYYDDLAGTYKNYAPVDTGNTGYLSVGLEGRNGSHPGGIFTCALPEGYSFLKVDFAATIYRNLDIGILNGGSSSQYTNQSWAQRNSVDCAQKYTGGSTPITISRQTISIPIDGAVGTSLQVCAALCSGSATNYATSVDLYNVWLE